ncbi:hypothetical protein [Streptomyces camelliae]|uniref:Lipoprotein n=1 Tax=Streptomyces camelliae TaxID=3004093 RepID=A0ABY7NZ12_9ACTN|nr:hypothetical protein [Streptomyces sp. HUAS 2-6]WBO63481.1 hypothetical protein O1G22_11910 [Streptomyces sp. HUAS 2-6]
MNARRAAAAVCAALTLVSACGGHAEATTPLTASQAKTVLPDARALPGWKVSIEPVAYTLKEARSVGAARCERMVARNSCVGVQNTGTSAFSRTGQPLVYFLVQTYQDEASAKSAYGTVWKSWKQEVPESRVLWNGKIREESDALVGSTTSMVKGSKGLLIQVRVGSVIMVSMAEAGAQVDMADSYLDRFADAFAKRAEEVQEGTTPSAGLMEN